MIMNEPALSVNLHQARVLVVDDHPGTAMTLARAISQLGPDIEVVSATSGKMALEQVRDNAVDLVITDMMMPEMNGLELIEKLQSHPGGQPAYIILITAYDVPGLKESARRLKVNETIIKPFRPEYICQVVSKALEDFGPSKLSKKTTELKQSHKILIADDVQDNLSLLSRYMVNEGYTFVTANNGNKALELTRSEMPDLILLDINMPEKDGFEVLKEIRLDPAIEHIPVIILTAARPNPEDIRAGLELGADDYVTKPFDRRELLARIRTKLRAKESEGNIRRRNKELSVLPEIGKELSARLDMDELTDIILRRSVETLGAMLGQVFILNPGGPLLKEYRVPSSASPAFDIHLPPLEEFLNQAKETRQGTIINDTHEDARWRITPENPSGSAIIVPLFGRLDVLGILVLVHEKKGYFNSEHQLLLQAIASQAAIALENVILYANMSPERQRMEAIFQSTADAILTFGADGSLTMLNPAGEKLFSNEGIKQGLPLTRGSGYDALIDLLDKVSSSRKAETKEIPWPDKRVFTALITPIENDGFVAILHDVTHFKDLERAKDEFISTASHDLKNPISIIKGYMELLPKVGTLNKKQVEYIGFINSATETMNELAGNILELAKIATGMKLQLEELDVCELLEKITNEFQLLARVKKQSLVFEKRGDIPRIEADPIQLGRALCNLVGNAIKYTPLNGAIKIFIEVKENNLSINVADNGFGISADDMPFIFDRFFRVHHKASKDEQGNGLGLAIVKSIAEQHKGTISVESESGEGSCFTITLPLTSKRNTESGKKESSTIKSKV
jgi:signal transduction histidine kinase/CheY-like chemotaxis protein